MRKKIIKRFLCLALAVQMLLTSVVHAVTPSSVSVDSSRLDDLILRFGQNWETAYEDKRRERISSQAKMENVVSVVIPTIDLPAREKNETVDLLSEDEGLIQVTDYTMTTMENTLINQDFTTSDTAISGLEIADQMIAEIQDETTKDTKVEEPAIDDELTVKELESSVDTQMPEEDKNPSENETLETLEPSDGNSFEDVKEDNLLDEDEDENQDVQVPEKSEETAEPSGPAGNEPQEPAEEAEGDLEGVNAEGLFGALTEQAIAPYAETSDMGMQMGMPPIFFLLKIGGYGSEYGLNSGYIEYNLEWDKAVSGDERGILTQLFAPYMTASLYGQLLDEGHPAFGSDQYFVGEASSDPMAFSTTYFTGDLDDVPRLPDKIFDGWYVRMPSGEPYVDEMGGVLPYSNFYYEGNEWTTVREGTDDVVPFDSSKPLNDYMQYVDYPMGGNPGNPAAVGMALAIIGKWNDSNIAAATDLILKPYGTSEDAGIDTLVLYPYEEGIETKTAIELNALDTADFAADREKELAGETATNQYFVRLPYSAECLDFDLTAYEPGSTLVVTTQYGTGETTVISTTHKSIPERNGNDFPANSLDDPARGLFSVDLESAVLSLGEYNNAKKNEMGCNIITLTITAPDGETTAEYVIYVQRMTEPVMELSPGNTPYGMIAREDSGSFDTGDAAAVKAQQDAYYNNNFQLNTSVLQGSSNNYQGIYSGHYNARAWSASPGNSKEENLDLDPGAVVVYMDSSFKLPGFHVRDSVGTDRYDYDSDIEIDWELPLTIIDGPITPYMLVDVDNLPEGTVTEEMVLTSKDADENGIINLHGVNVKPGVYTLTYQYTDPFDTLVHDEWPQGFCRTVIIMPLRGDVDLDGEVTVADGVMLQKLLDEDYFFDVDLSGRPNSNTSTDRTKRMYYYRVCDVVDGEAMGSFGAQENDVEALLNGYETPVYTYREEGKQASADYYYYLPLLYTEPQLADELYDPYMPERTAPDLTEDVTGEKATLSVEYLGVAKEQEDGTVIYDDKEPIDYDVDVTSVFWMGVKMEKTENLPDALQTNLTTFTFTLTYDGGNVAPWFDEDKYSVWVDYIMSVNPQWEGYKPADSTKVDITPVTHSSKAAVGLQGNTAEIRELRFSVQLVEGDGVSLTDLSANDGYLLKVPFELTAYPRAVLGNEETDDDGVARHYTKLVEPALGMYNFVMTTDYTDDDTAFGVATWNNRSTTQNQAATTVNLKGLLAAGNEEKDMQIPVGENNTPGEPIKVNGVNAVYGTFVDIASLPAGVTSVYDETTLPPGLRFDAARGCLTGTPEKAGTYNFDVRIGTSTELVSCTMVIEKAPLTLQVQPVYMYYGELNDPVHTTKQTFRYDRTQIKELDFSGKDNSGSEEDLIKLLEGDAAYTRPTITLVTSLSSSGTLGAQVSDSTEPGTYVVILSGGSSSNYKFQYVRVKAEESGTEDSWKGEAYDAVGSNELFILPRPIQVAKVTKEPLGTTLETANPLGATLEGQKADYQEKEFTFASVAVNGIYHNDEYGVDIPLSAATIIGQDKLVLDYTAHVPDAGITKLTSVAELRDAVVQLVALPETDGTRNHCYDIVSTVPADRTGRVLVQKRVLEKVWIGGHPENIKTEYTYGESLDLGALFVDLVYQHDLTNTIQLNNWVMTENGTNGIRDVYDLYEMTLQWVDEDGAIPDAAPTVDYPNLAYSGQRLSVIEHDGKWLCISVPTGKETAGEMAYERLYVGPIVVHKRELTITPVAEVRYYGEADKTWQFHYNPEELTWWDYEALPASKTGNQDELQSLSQVEGTGLTNYKVPQVLRWTTSNHVTGGKEVSRQSGAGRYYVLFYGMESDNYSFKYTCTNWSGETTTTVTSVKPADEAAKNATVVGYTTLEVIKRPIVVTKIDSSAGTILYGTETYKINPAQATVGPDLEPGYTAQLPQLSEIATVSTSYLVPNGDGTAKNYEVVRFGLELTDSAICSWDTVTLQYNAEFTRDILNSPYFDMGDKLLRDDVSVSVSELKLSGNAANNYELLYITDDAAIYGQTTTTDGIVTGTVGTVAMRTISSIKVVSAPVKSLQGYSYGDSLSLTGLAVAVTYEGAAGDPTQVTYVDYATPNRFAEQGLSVHWTTKDGALVAEGQTMTVADHNGKCLVVTAQRPDGTVLEAEVQSNINLTLQVKPRTLTLTADSITRAYGEENGTYSFSFDVNDLAPADRQIFIDEGLTATGSASAQNVPADSAALSRIDPTYKGPIFITEAEKKSDAREAGYQLRLSGGSMTNYTFTLKNGEIKVDKRPIYVYSVKKDPIYSVSYGAVRKEYTVSCYQAWNGQDQTNNDLDIRLFNDPKLPTTGDTIVEGDTVSVAVTIRFLSTSTPGRQQVQVVENGLSLQGGENYELRLSRLGSSNPLDSLVYGEVKNLEVDYIVLEKAPKMDYQYGETLDLSAMEVRVYYKTEEGETPMSSMVNPLNEAGFYVNYWDGRYGLDTQLDWSRVPTWNNEAKTGDHLTIATDEKGFAHNGKYLIISAKETADSTTYVKPVITSIPLTVHPRELTFQLDAEGKTYDTTTQGQGTITLENVYPGDQVWVNNGADYSDVTLPENGKYMFHSSDTYGEGFTFTFATPNAAGNIALGVDNIALLGRDAANYTITRKVGQTDVKAPHATISRDPVQPYSEKSQEFQALQITLEVDQHTNTVKVSTDKPASAFRNPNDQKKGDVKYEYALLYLDEETGAVTYTTGWQDSPYFGGEAVGQQAMSGDRDFGNRSMLPRGTYMGALVRLAQTTNYEPSASVCSFGDVDDPQKALEAIEEAKNLPEPKENERIEERKTGAVVKTYTYRFELYASEEVKVTGNNESSYTVSLDAVWFTDIAQYATQKELDRLVDNMSTSSPRYTGYYWEETKSVTLTFPSPNGLDLTQEIRIEVPVKAEDGTTTRVEKWMNEPDDNGNVNLRIYVTAERRNTSSGGSISPKSVKILSDDLLVWVGDAPVKLELAFEPENANDKRVYWSSSDPAVVTVSRDGVLTFVGPGTATITVQTWNRLTDSIVVQVLDSTQLPYGDTMFNTGYTGSFMGTFNGYFRPEDTMTRSELTVIMELFFRMIEGYETVEPDVFLDVPADAPYMEQLDILNRWQIVNGIGEEQYAPDRTATRAEISIVLCRMLMLPIETDPNGPHAFYDAGPEDTWAWAYIDALAKAGITIGTGDDGYSPNRLVTRAEVATFIARILATKTDMQAETLIVPLDVTEDHWAYQSILRAVNEGAILAFPSRKDSEENK
ncbi:MAG: hypothetical protein HFF04_08010 [Oscillospiraceae bacterium]|nr:hypothetical protein [Oscillospiraceae bacterium]